jgi:hypothetical protein
MKSISYISIKDCYIDKFISTNCSEEKQEEEEEDNEDSDDEFDLENKNYEPMDLDA